MEKITLRLHMTKELQKNELGLLVLGTDHNLGLFSLLIPPGLDKVGIKSYCLKRDLAKVYLNFSTLNL